MRRFLPLLLLTAACGPIDPPPPTNEDGEELILPAPYDTYLGVSAEYPEVLGTSPTLRFVFDAHIDTDQLLDFAVVRVSSAGISSTGRVTWEMTTRTLTFRPFGELVPGLRYRPSIDTTAVFSVTGSPMLPVELPEFVVEEDGDNNEDPQTTPVNWSTVESLLQAKCASCHADPNWQLNPLTRESLVGQRSDQLDRLLVVPFDPGDSYLLHKVLDDYPVRRFTVQPPPWSDAEPLTHDEVRLIERWIATGAQP